MRHRAMHSARATGLRGYHVLGGFLTFFGIVLAVNGAMIYSAITTHTGLVAIEPYRKGLHYNDRIAASERQERLGWTVAIDVQPQSILLRIAESDGRPVRGLKISAVLGRPSTDRHDLAVTLVEGELGAYTAALPSLPPGSWQVAIEAARSASDDVIFRERRRLWLKP